MLVPLSCWGCRAPCRRGRPLCSTCSAALRRLAAEPVAVGGVRVWAPLAYEGPARELVRALKFRGAAALADWMAAQLVANAPEGWLDGLGSGGLVPVPLHRRRRRARGFNQAGLIAQAVGRRAGMLVFDCLERRGGAGTQVGRGRRERGMGAPGRILLAGSPPRRALLVDDVVTTGGTLAACATALRDGGCSEVAAVALARTLGR